MIDVIASQRRNYIRATARALLEEMEKIEPYKREYWLAGKLNEAFDLYFGELERIVNVSQKLACDALNLKTPEPIYLPKP